MLQNEDLYIGLTLNFGNRVKGQREHLGLTQKELAEIVGVSKTTIQNYESGNIPKGLFLFKLSRCLECSIDYLLLGEESPYIQKEWIAERPFGMNQEELAKYYGKIKGTWLESLVFYQDEDDYIIKNGSPASSTANIVEAKQDDILKQFKDKHYAMDLTSDLVELERLSLETFKKVGSYIKGVVDGVRMMATDYQPYTGSERRKAERRVNQDESLIPVGGDRRSGQNRRKASAK